MFQILQITAGQVATLFCLMAFGYVLRKLGRIGDGMVSDCSFILLYVVMPCLIVSSFVEANISNYGVFIWAMLGCCICFVASVLLGILFIRKPLDDTKRTLRFGTTYPNNGFMGFPLVSSIFGAEAIVVATGYMIINTTFMFTHGMTLMGEKKDLSIKKALINPGTVSLIMVGILIVTGLIIPSPIGNAIAFVGSLNTPLAMLIIGAQMADADFLPMFRNTSMYLVSFIKLISLPVITAAVLMLLKAPSLAVCATSVLAATPSGGLTAMFAQRYNRDTATAARLVSFTTLVSIFTMTIFATFIQVVSPVK